MKVLFLTDYFFPNGSPNGNCVKDVAHEFKVNGHEVYVLGFKGYNEKVVQLEYPVYKLKPSFWFWLRDMSKTYKNRMIRKFLYSISIWGYRIKRILTMHMYPLVSRSFLKDYCDFACNLIKTENIDLVVGVYNPVESFFVIKQLKKKNPSLKCVIYAFDSLSNIASSRFMSSSMKDKLGWRREKDFFKYPDYILLMECHKNFYLNKRYDAFRDKIKFMDIPLYFPEKYRKVQYEKNIKIDKKRVLYAGSFDYKKRNPFKFIEIIKELLAQDSEYKFYIYTNLECYGEFEKLKKEFPLNIFVSPYIDDEKLVEEELKSDLLVSVGVKSDAITSKIFRYFSTGHKSIHLYNYDKDPANQYYDLYCNGKKIYLEQDTKVIVREIVNLMKQKNYSVDENSFKKNKPLYVLEKVEELYGF